MTASDKAKLFPEVTQYGNQTYYMPEHDVAFSLGSFGQRLRYRRRRDGSFWPKTDFETLFCNVSS